VNRAISLLAGYGAFELKQAYRKNMFIGMFTAIALHLVIIGSIFLISYLSSKPPEVAGTIVINPSTDLGAPPTLYPKDIPIRVTAPERAQPSIGVPTPVPEEDAPEGVEVATMDDLAAMVALLPIIDLDESGDKNIIIEDLEELLPSPNDFVACEEMPTQVVTVHPDYPEMARRAQIEGVVWVKALVDKKGKVRDVIILKESGANAGFEEAAFDAAMKTEWKPAISNGQPVIVWVSYRIIFTLTTAK